MIGSYLQLARYLKRLNMKGRHDSKHRPIGLSFPSQQVVLVLKERHQARHQYKEGVSLDLYRTQTQMGRTIDVGQAVDV